MTGTIDMNVWAGWIERACNINEYAAPDRESKRTAAHSPSGQPSADSPGSDFNRRGSWEEAGLFESGWSWVRRHGVEDRGLICRPGKDDGVSASVGMVTSKDNGWPLFWCWSTSVPEFVPEQGYSRFGVFATLRHGGDYSAAAKELASRGYGNPPVEVLITLPGKNGTAPSVASAGVEPPPIDRAFRWMSELQFRPVNDKWIWDGYLSRGGVTLLSALWKAGKSTLLSHLIRACDGRAETFLDRPITPTRVLYISEEHEELWAERRDELNIGDHVGMICRPFKGRPSPAEWAAFIGVLVKAVNEYRFDLVIFDTLSKLWPVREENDSGAVEDALMPLWNITNQGAALLMIHHNRKSGGDDFTGMRGSGGLPAFCETLIAFSRYAPDGDRTRKRLLEAKGRYRETPEKLLIELTPAGYVSHGDPDDPDCRAVIKLPGWRDRLDVVIPDRHPGLSLVAIHDALKDSPDGDSVRNQDLIAVLTKRIEGGELLKAGKGSKGSPFTYYRPSIDGDTVPPLRTPGEQNPGTE